MSQLVVVATSSAPPLPGPRMAYPLSFRLATPADIPALDALQKPYGKALGFFKTQYFEGYIKLGGVLVAECNGTLVGYCVSRDRYLKRDELGVIYQLCVAPGEQRKLVGAALVQEVFRRSAYGCRLYCLWCAQDLEANYFWESLGFVPLAFRAGSARKKRVHIFWQKRIVDGDTETKWWYPFQTASGAIREDRLVFPIPAGVHWKDVQAVAVPVQETQRLEAPALGPAYSQDKYKQAPSTKPKAPNPVRSGLVPLGGFRFESELLAAPPKAEKRAKPPKAAPARVKIDPQFLAAARELRDRYLEHVNSGGMMLP